mmetsp:Transcript_23214/g.50157  ORF Transcript_23214/g.50157 Transcript_23214/m.50157 type:complete len:251 (+) Transcript_23214:724-1476(+)
MPGAGYTPRGLLLQRSNLPGPLRDPIESPAPSSGGGHCKNARQKTALRSQSFPTATSHQKTPTVYVDSSLHPERVCQNALLRARCKQKMHGFAGSVTFTPVPENKHILENDERRMFRNQSMWRFQIVPRKSVPPDLRTSNLRPSEEPCFSRAASFFIRYPCAVPHVRFRAKIEFSTDRLANAGVPQWQQLKSQGNRPERKSELRFTFSKHFPNSSDFRTLPKKERFSNSSTVKNAKPAKCDCGGRGTVRL